MSNELMARPPREKVVVTGIGTYCSIAGNTAAYSDALRAGKKGFVPVDPFRDSGFRNSRAALVQDVEERPTRGGMREAILLRHAVEEAVADSGVMESGVAKSRVGVSIGTSVGGAGGFVDWLLSGESPEDVFTTPLNRWNKLSGSEAVLNIPPILLAYEVAERYGFSAGISAACTACSAGANSLAVASDYLRRDRADVMLAGGVDPINEMTLMGFNALKAISPTEPAPFDRDRTGLLVGEGAGLLVLEKESHARRRGARVYAEFAGYGLSNDAYHVTQPHPEGAGAIVAMRQALRRAGLEPDDIQYINTHGTGTRHNDLMELKAIRAVFGERAPRVPLSSIKGMIGHTLGAAGTLEAIATVLALYHGYLPPNANFKHPIEDFEYRVVREAEEQPDLDVAMSNSFAFGGNCASLIFRRN